MSLQSPHAVASSKQGTSFRLTKAARAMLAAIAKREGIDKTDVIELLIRRKAEECALMAKGLPGAWIENQKED